MFSRQSSQIGARTVVVVGATVGIVSRVVFMRILRIMLMLRFFLAGPMPHRVVSLAVRVTFGLVVTVLNVRPSARRTSGRRAHLMLLEIGVGLYWPTQASHTLRRNGLLGSVLGLLRCS